MISTEAQLKTVAQLGINPVTFITGVKYNTNLVKAFNNVTFLYDPNWEYESGNPTYPLAFFYIKKITEVMQSDVSKKPLLFYNSASDATNGTKSGVLNIVTDNIVTTPKTYRMEILIPANGTTLKNTTFGATSIANVLSFSLRKTKDASAVSNLASFSLNVANTAMNIMDALLKGLYGLTVSAESMCNMMLNQQDYNKASIEYMWRNRRIIGLKYWNGWKFKYIVITECSIDKEGLDGDFYSGTIVCQEMPILTFRKQSSTSLSFLSQISSALGTAQKAVAKVFVNAMTSTFGE